MAEPYLSTAAVYLIDTVFTVYLFLLMLRFLLQLVRASFYNPLSQFLVKATNPLLVPLRRIVPGLWGLDLSSIVLLYVLQYLALVLTHLAAGIGFSFTGIAILTVGELIGLLLNCYLIAIIAQVILSWIGPGGRQPISDLLYSLTEPVLAPMRRLLPVMGGLDFSPLVAIVLIQLAKILIMAPIVHLGRVMG